MSDAISDHFATPTWTLSFPVWRWRVDIVWSRIEAAWVSREPKPRGFELAIHLWTR